MVTKWYGKYMKDQLIRFRLTSADKKKIVALAKHEKKTLTDYIMEKCLGRELVNK